MIWRWILTRPHILTCIRSWQAWWSQPITKTGIIPGAAMISSTKSSCTISRLNFCLAGCCKAICSTWAGWTSLKTAWKIWALILKRSSNKKTTWRLVMVGWDDWLHRLWTLWPVMVLPAMVMGFATNTVCLSKSSSTATRLNCQTTGSMKATFGKNAGRLIP